MKKPRVLVVDDDECLVEMISFGLSDRFDVITASNGAEAWDLFRAKSPIAVVTDILMPEVNGFDLIRQIRDSGRSTVVAMTGSMEDNLLKAKSEGADFLLSKPFNVELLAQYLETAR